MRHRSKPSKQPVKFLDSQDNRFVADIGRCFESLGLEALEPKAEAVALPVQNFQTVARFVEKDEEHGVEHGDLNVQFNQRGEPINGLSEVDRLGVEIDFFDFCIGSHHGELAPEGIGSTASGIS